MTDFSTLVGSEGKLEAARGSWVLMGVTGGRGVSRGERAQKVDKWHPWDNVTEFSVFLNATP